MGGDKKGLSEMVHFRGKEVSIKKIQKHIRHKPSIIGTVLINMAIIITIIMAILLIVGG